MPHAVVRRQRAVRDQIDFIITAHVRRDLCPGQVQRVVPVAQKTDIVTRSVEELVVTGTSEEHDLVLTVRDIRGIQEIVATKSQHNNVSEIHTKITVLNVENIDT